MTTVSCIQMITHILDNESWNGCIDHVMFLDQHYIEKGLLTLDLVHLNKLALALDYGYIKDTRISFKDKHSNP